MGVQKGQNYEHTHNYLITGTTQYFKKIQNNSNSE
jgi:hypothetical protein